MDHHTPAHTPTSGNTLRTQKPLDGSARSRPRSSASTGSGARLRAIHSILLDGIPLTYLHCTQALQRDRCVSHPINKKR